MIRNSDKINQLQRKKNERENTLACSGCKRSADWQLTKGGTNLVSSTATDILTEHIIFLFPALCHNRCMPLVQLCIRFWVRPNIKFVQAWSKLAQLDLGGFAFRLLLNWTKYNSVTLTEPQISRYHKSVNSMIFDINYTCWWWSYHTPYTYATSVKWLRRTGPVCQAQMRTECKEMWSKNKGLSAFSRAKLQTIQSNIFLLVSFLCCLQWHHSLKKEY